MRACTLIVATVIVLAVLTAAGCVSGNAAWSFTINGNTSMTVNGALYDRLINCSQTYDGVTGIPLEIFLYDYGVDPVTSVSFGGTTYNWTTVALSADRDRPMLLTENGSIFYDDHLSGASDMQVQTTEKMPVSTLDVEPSVLYALGAGVSKPDLIPDRTTQVVLVYVDAFGYQRYENSLQQGLVANISSLGEPIEAMAEYPSVSQNNAKSLVTGQPPDLARGDFRGYIPENETMFDIVDSLGMRSVWVDGATAPVYVNNIILNPEVNNSSSSADEAAMDTAIRQYEAGVNLIVVHIDSTDSIMHQYGPDTPQGEAAVSLADTLVGRLMESMKPGSVLVVWADHGCHQSGDTGDHGTLLPSDMYIPVFVHQF